MVFLLSASDPISWLLTYWGARRGGGEGYARYFDGGREALEDKPTAPSRVWNRLPNNVRKQIIDMALFRDWLMQSALPQNA